MSLVEDRPAADHRVIQSLSFASRRGPLLVAVLAGLTISLPLLLFLHRMAQHAAMSLFADDAYYYLAIAQKAAVAHFPTFDGTHRTNGFHPVWEALLMVLTRTGWLDGTAIQRSIHRTALLDLGLLTLAFGGIGWVAARNIREPWLALLATRRGSCGSALRLSLHTRWRVGRF